MIASYPNDAPFPNALVLGFDQGRPVHVVVARDAGARLCHVVTVYFRIPMCGAIVSRRRNKHEMRDLQDLRNKVRKCHRDPATR